MLKNILNLGDAALYCDFGDEVNKEINSNVIKYFNFLKKRKIDEITNLTPSYNKLIISFDLNKTNFFDLKKFIESIKIESSLSGSIKKIEIPVCCDPTFSLDIKRLEDELKLEKESILKNFFEKEYFCYMTGFIAGMPFLGDVDKKLRYKRLDTPRIKVPKGSIGLTEKFANIYTFESPGGWNIIGNTPINIFNNKNENAPNLINPGDLVTFKEISIEEYNKFLDE